MIENDDGEEVICEYCNKEECKGCDPDAEYDREIERRMGL